MTPEELMNADVAPAARPPYANHDYETNQKWRVGYMLQATVEAARAAADGTGQIAAAMAEIRANLVALSGRDWVDEEAIVAGVLAGLGTRDLEDVATALRSALGPDRVAELAALLAAPGEAPAEPTAEG